jgi:hypothetical protein
MTQSGHRGRKVLALHVGLLAKGHNMKTKTFEPGAICAALALLVVFSLPAYAKSGGSSASHTRVGKTPSKATSVKPVTSSGKTQSGTSQKYQLKSESKGLDQKANSLQIKVNEQNKQNADVQKAEQQRDKNKAALDNMQKFLDIQKNIDPCRGGGC